MYQPERKAVFGAFADLSAGLSGAVDGVFFLCFYLDKDTETVQIYSEKVREQP